MKSLKQHVPDWLKRAYHRARGFIAAFQYGFPAEKMIIVGITGTKGKTSTANYTWSVLSAGGYKAGLISSANFRIDTVEEPNPYHMTMPDPFLIQRKMREMLDANISVVCMEMTSEGMKQYRHSGIPVDIAVFTNLTPEHLSSHGNSFEEYKLAKVPLFRDALNHPHKIIGGKVIPRVIIANADSEHSELYLSFPADQKITYGISSGEIRATAIIEEKTGTRFVVSGEKMHLAIPGLFNVYNALPACVVGTVLGVSVKDIKLGLDQLAVIPGRMELVDGGQPFTVIIDYAHEPAGMEALLTSTRKLCGPNGKVILLTGVIGGGRESRKPLIRVATQKADVLVITNEDPYDDDPEKMISELVATALNEGMLLEQNLFETIDRKEAIMIALRHAQAGDVVIISGKGAEQTMMTATGAVPWDERAIVRQSVQEYLQTN